MSISIETQNGKRIVRATYADCETKEKMMQIADELTNVVNAFDGELLVLSDLTDTYVSSEFMDRVKQNAKKLTREVDKSAVIGISGLKKIFVNGYNRVTGRNMKAFDSEEDAIKYLTTD